MAQEQYLLEKYFPKSFDEVFLPKAIKDEILAGLGKTAFRLLLHSSPGTGKCLGKNTPVIMYDGTTKMVQDIIIGDKLMGIDGTPRNVLSIARGQEMLYDIIQNTGDNFVCNESHILSVIESGTYSKNEDKPKYIEDINLLDAKMLPINHRKKLFKVKLNFPEQPVKINPYLLGYWLGDGDSCGPRITIGTVDDYEIMYPIMDELAKEIGCWLTETFDKRNWQIRILNFSANESTKTSGIAPQHQFKNLFREYLKEYKLINNKHIPKEYLLNSREIRLQLFAGLVDSDSGGDCSDKIYDFCLVRKDLSDDLTFLCRSLGYRVNQKPKIINGKTYWRTIISGDFSDVPVRIPRKKYQPRVQIKNPLVSGFKIYEKGIGDYYGFEIDGDKRFLLGDFTVTHNTTSARLLSQNYDSLYLSGSNDFNIDTIRNRIMPFASGHSVLGKKKLIIIDECENIRDSLQDSFKITFDQCLSTSFIFITNEINKVNSAIKSRSNQICFDFVGENLKEQKVNYVQFMKKICSTENIKFTAEGFKELYRTTFPDFRQLLILLQKFKDTNSTISDTAIVNLYKSGKENTELYDIICTPSIQGKQMYESLSKFKSKEHDCFLALGEPFFEYLNAKDMFDQTLKASVIVSKYTDLYLKSINKFTTLLACVVELKTIFR